MYVVPGLIGALILCSTFVISYQLLQYQNEIRESNKEKFESTIENTISRREGRVETIASSMVALYANSDTVTDAEFNNFAEMILGNNQEISNVFILNNNTITQSFPIKEHVGEQFDVAFPTYPTQVAGRSAMTAEFPISKDLLLIIAIPFDYFIQEGVVTSNNYKLVLLSPTDDNVRLYSIEKRDGMISHEVVFSEEELRDSITVEHQTSLFGHKIRKNYDLKYIVWDAAFKGQVAEQAVVLGVGGSLSAIIPALLIRSNLLRSQLRDKSEMLEKLNQELTNVEKSKDEFVTMIVHDLKNPLVPIQAYAEILLMQSFGSLNEKQAQRVQSIKNNALALQKMIQDLLDANKLGLGKLRLDIQDHRLDEIIKKEVSELDSEFQKKGVTVTVECPEAVSCECDKSRIGQVLNNILLNAIDFVNENTGTITVSLRSDQKFARILIKDNGVGVAKDKLDGLFVKFYQIRPDQQRKYGGTGLGLSVCKGIIENHNGRIWAESEGEGKGTEVHIEIPLRHSG